LKYAPAGNHSDLHPARQYIAQLKSSSDNTLCRLQTVVSDQSTQSPSEYDKNMKNPAFNRRKYAKWL